ncbi:MAG: hypothetical protein RMH84_04950, partial [Sulfolobales archaeon]|nr:hypothetical protein [Sulfolobales archaeon]MDW8010922.1 hypothetical protein [Sulfolobales archaeon]
CSSDLDPEEVDERIKKQAIGMLEASGLNKDKIIEILAELKLVVEVLIDLVGKEKLQEIGKHSSS